MRFLADATKRPDWDEERSGLVMILMHRLVMIPGWEIRETTARYLDFAAALATIRELALT